MNAPDTDEQGHQRLRAVTLCFLVALLEGYDIQAIGVAAPRLAPALGLLPEQLGLIFAIANVGIVLGAAIGGWIADRLGRRFTLVVAVAMFGVCTLGTVLVGNFPELFAARLLTGFGLGAALPNIMALAVEVSAPERRVSTTTMMFCGMPMGGAASAWAISLLPFTDWKTLFLVGGLLPLLLAPLLHLGLPVLRPPTLSPVQRIGVWRGLFGDGRAWPTALLAVIYFPTLLILYLLLNWLPTLVVANGLPKSIAPQASLLFNLGGATGALILGCATDRFGFRSIATGAYLALIAAMMALARAHTTLETLIGSGLAGIALLGAQYGLYGVGASYYPRQVRGLGSGWIVAVGRLGSIVGPLIAGMWLAQGATAGDVISWIVPYAACAAVATFALSFFSNSKTSEESV